MNNIICIAGPTASGKTALAVELAKELNGEVVSCDSMQVYKRMDIGTAKPTPQQMQGIPHHMIDVAEPWEDYSVSRFCAAAAPIVEDIAARGHGITIRTLFHLAKENGVSVSFPAEKPQQNFPSADGNDGTDGMLEIAAPESMPTFSR